MVEEERKKERNKEMKVYIHIDKDSEEILGVYSSKEVFLKHNPEASEQDFQSLQEDEVQSGQEVDLIDE